MDELFGLGDFFDLIFEGTLSEKTVSGFTTEPENAFDYLKKGERIMTLLRKKKRKKFRKSGFLDSVNYRSFMKEIKGYGQYLFLSRCVRDKMVAPALEQCIENGTDFSSFLALFCDFQDSFEMKVVDKEGQDYKLMSDYFRKKTADLESVVGFRVQGINGLAPLGKKAKLSCKQNGQRRKFIWQKEYTLCVDLTKYMLPMIIQLQTRKLIQELLINIPKEEQVNNVILDFILGKLMRKMERFYQSGLLMVERRALEHKIIREFLDRMNIPFYSEVNSGDQVMSLMDFSLLFYLSPDREVLSVFLSEEYLPHPQGGKPIYTSALCFGNEINSVVLIFEKLLEVYHAQKSEEKYLRKLDSDYAKSFQTKKNIPEKTLKAMQSSKFNNYFGYIEFDEDCDLEKMENLYRKFSELAEFFHWEKREEVSLRFRRLGNHKASGLYYMFLKCLCVDISNPTSFAHEYFHMLDYENGEASQKKAFYKVYELYKSVFMENKECSEALEKRKTKYNLEYYLRNTEVFARCGEIYLVDILGIDNSVVKPSEGFAYPKSKELLDAIEEYFNAFLGKSKEEILRIRQAG